MIKAAIQTCEYAVQFVRMPSSVGEYEENIWRLFNDVTTAFKPIADDTADMAVCEPSRTGTIFTAYTLCDRGREYLFVQDQPVVTCHAKAFLYAFSPNLFKLDHDFKKSV